MANNTKKEKETSRLFDKFKNENLIQSGVDFSYISKFVIVFKDYLLKEVPSLNESVHNEIGSRIDFMELNIYKHISSIFLTAYVFGMYAYEKNPKWGKKWIKKFSKPGIFELILPVKPMHLY